MEQKKVPELRFKQADGTEFPEWKKKKIDSLTIRLDSQRVPIAAGLRKAGKTPYYGANGIQDYVDGFTHDGEFVLVAEDGANDIADYSIIYVKGHSSLQLQAASPE